MLILLLLLPIRLNYGVCLLEMVLLISEIMYYIKVQLNMLLVMILLILKLYHIGMLHVKVINNLLVVNIFILDLIKLSMISILTVYQYLYYRCL
jgi:hypothetical protein